MPTNRQSSQRHGKSPRRKQIDPHIQYKILKRSDSRSRGASVPARKAASFIEERECRRCSSPHRSLMRRSESIGLDCVRKSRSPFPHQRRSLERRSHSEPQPSRDLFLAAAGAGTLAADENESSLRQLCLLLIQHGGPTGDQKAEDFLHANLDPPVTRQSLSELDIGSIVSNSKLRHDINFDRELHFRPNLDGARGRVKKRAQSEYWSALAAELQLYSILFTASDSPKQERLRAVCKQRIPRMFEAVRDILKALVPEQDQPAIDAHMDVGVIMQEIERGICDLRRIARWLAEVLKAHCAPMRDGLIDKMVSCIDKGVQDESAEMLVEGIVQLFGAMEAMKLDVANHQIRHLRLVLIEDTIGFEQRYHCGRIARRRMDPDRSRQWYLEHVRSNPGDGDATVRMNTFLHGLLNLVFFPFNTEPFPATLNLDFDRLRNLRSDISDLFCIDACENVFLDLGLAAGVKASQQARDDLRSALCSVITLSGYNTAWDDNLENVGLEVVRHLLALLEQDGRQLDSERERQLRNTAKDALRTIFSDPKRSFFWARGIQARDDIFPVVAANLKRFVNLSPVDIFNAFISPCGDTSLRQKQILGKIAPQTLSAGTVLADVIRRISHIAVLHWRIWAPIVYLYEPDPTAAQAAPAAMSRSASAMRDSPAPVQCLSTSNEAAWSEAEDGADKDEASVAASSPPPPTASSAAADADLMAIGSGGHDAGVLGAGEEPSSPVLYRQPTNG